DPATGERGRASLPGFLEDFAADGAELELAGCDLRPAVAATEGSPLGAAGGLHGWRLRREADGSWLGEGVDGRRVRLAAGPRPVGLLDLPGGARLTVGPAGNAVSVLDARGVVLGRVAPEQGCPEYAAGTPLVPAVPWWHVLRPRDEAGSAALRAVTREAVDAMIAAVPPEGDGLDRRERLAALVRGERDDVAAAV
ncbi:hypothetical protein J7S33_00395, partial [Saccharothrix algeriensis]